jgi:hypothetical protein
MLRKRTRYRLCSAVFLLALVGVAAFGAYSGRASSAVSTAEDPVAEYTRWLVYVTGGLVLVALFQNWFLYQADKTARISAEAAKASVDSARQEFVATHRPRMRIRRIHFDGDATILDPLSATLWVVNVGEAVATIEGIEFGFARKQNGGWLNRQMPVLGTGLTALSEPNCKAGEPKMLGLIRATPPLDAQAKADINSGEHEFCIVGVVRYHDEIGITRETGFCWSYDLRAQDFRKPMGNDEFNYED